MKLESSGHVYFWRVPYNELEFPCCIVYVTEIFVFKKGVSQVGYEIFHYPTKLSLEELSCIKPQYISLVNDGTKTRAQLIIDFFQWKFLGE